MLARVFDLALLFYGAVLVESELISRLFGKGGGNLADAFSAREARLVLVVVLMSVVLELVPVAVWGRTLGKAMLGMQVVRIEDARVPGVVRAFGRWLPLGAAVLAPTIGLPLYVLAGMALFTNRSRRSVADLIAGTVVIDHRVEQPSPPRGSRSDDG